MAFAICSLHTNNMNSTVEVRRGIQSQCTRIHRTSYKRSAPLWPLMRGNIRRRARAYAPKHTASRTRAPFVVISGINPARTPAHRLQAIGCTFDMIAYVCLCVFVRPHVWGSITITPAFVRARVGIYGIFSTSARACTSRGLACVLACLI